jgi:hypothetical protein
VPKAITVPLACREALAFGSGPGPGSRRPRKAPASVQGVQPSLGVFLLSLGKRYSTARPFVARAVPGVLAARVSAQPPIPKRFPLTKFRVGSRFCLKKSAWNGISSIARILRPSRVEPANPRSDCCYQNHIRIRGRITWKLLLAFLARANARKKL